MVYNRVQCISLDTNYKLYSTLSAINKLNQLLQYHMWQEWFWEGVVKRKRMTFKMNNKLYAEFHAM